MIDVLKGKSKYAYLDSSVTISIDYSVTINETTQTTL
jgi:hypothetical protein